MAVEEVEQRPAQPPIESWTLFALAAAFISFVVPVVPALVALVVAPLAKRRLRIAGGDRMNERLATLAQVTALFTLSLVAIYIWWFELR